MGAADTFRNDDERPFGLLAEKDFRWRVLLKAMTAAPNTFDGKPVLVAGATGLAGAGIIGCLLDTYPDIVVRGTYNTTPPFIRHDRLEYVKADLTRREDCRRAAMGCGLAIMAAAQTGGAGSTKSEPERQVTDNLVMDALLLEALVHENVKRTVFISSATVYQPFSGAITEKEIDWKQDPYPAYFGVGWAKRSVEKLCQFWHETTGLEVIIARSSNIFGPFAKFDPKWSNFIPALIKKAVDGMNPFEVWGNEQVTRDVIYIEDFARAVIALLFQNAKKFDVYNLGSGIRTTVGEVVDWVLKAAHHHPERIVYSENQPTAIPFRALDCAKIKQATGWEPSFSIEEGVKLTTQWWIANRQWWKK